MSRSLTAVVLFAALPLASTVPAAAQSPAGCWVGTMTVGTSVTRAVFEFAQSGNSWSGAIHRLGAATRSDPWGSVSVEGASVRTTFPSTLGTGTATFEGVVDAGGLNGTIQSAGTGLAVEMMPVDPGIPDPATDLLGYWNGGLFQGDMLVLRLGLEIAPTACGQVHASMDSPDQGGEDAPATAVSFERNELIVEIGGIGGTFRGTANAARDSLSGTWSQMGQSFAMRLARGDGPVSFTRPQDPQPPFPYEEVEVIYENPDDGTRFAGTLTIPEGDGPYPAALMITGSGPQDRNESLMGHRPFLVIADYLTRRGIAVLRVDDRGVGGSTGNVMEATIADNIVDALAGVAFLRARDEIDPDRVGLIGHSEGGWVAPGVAAVSDDVAFIVMLAGPSVSGRELILEQSRVIMEASAPGNPANAAGLTINRIVLDAGLTGESVGAATEAVVRAMDEAIAAAAPEEARTLRAVWESESVQANVRQNLPSMGTPWYRYLVTYDPIEVLASLDLPVLALYGERDLQVPPEQSVPLLEVVWADHPDATIHVFPGLNHLFQHAETGLPAEYASIEETFAPEVLEMLGGWIAERVLER